MNTRTVLLFLALYSVLLPGGASGYDCIPLAESMGGGGHAQACGFRMNIARLPELLGGTFTA